jgi:glycerol-3-phosphate acyltransferase PlsX
MRIALDALGGDFAPAPNIEGAIAALNADPDLEVILVGETAQIDPLVQKTGYSGNRLRLQNCDGAVGMDEKPTEALRKKPNCSLNVCWQLMATREADAVVSAGNTGAVVAAGLRTRLFLPGVKRPGIAVALPTRKGRTVLMDVGANPAARPEHLVQYGVMGSIYARDVLGMESPRVGLMNIGSEEGKGTDFYRETHTALTQSPVKAQYIGNVEGRDLFQGSVEVIVCEGFVGNVLLKASEGMAEFLLHTMHSEVLGKLTSERDVAMQHFAAAARKYQHHESGGAPLLGVDGICIICHGSSNSRSIENALKVARTFKSRNINQQIVDSLKE